MLKPFFLVSKISFVNFFLATCLKINFSLGFLNEENEYVLPFNLKLLEILYAFSIINLLVYILFGSKLILSYKSIGGTIFKCDIGSVIILFILFCIIIFKSLKILSNVSSSFLIISNNLVFNSNL